MNISPLPSIPYSELLLADLQPHQPPLPSAVAATRLAYSRGCSCGLLIVSDLPPYLEALRAHLLGGAPSLPPLAALLSDGLGSDTSGPHSPASATLQLRWGAEGPQPAGAPPPPPDCSLRAGMEALGAAYAAICGSVAAACDVWAGGCDLRGALRASGAAKARLILYGAEGGGAASAAPWQQYHKDYGLFTAVSAPTYWEGATPAAPPHGAGLHVLRAGSGARAAAPIGAGCVGVQAGEASQLLSGGRVVAAPHVVLRPAGGGGAWQRATFVVFCTPPAELALAAAGGGGVEEEEPAWAEVLGGLLPPMHERWDAQSPPTFSEFGRRTVAAYFGKKGTQRRQAK